MPGKKMRQRLPNRSCGMPPSSSRMTHDSLIGHLRLRSARDLRFSETSLNSDNPGSLPALAHTRFEEWAVDPKTHRATWKPYAEILKPNEVMGDAGSSIDISAAPMPPRPSRGRRSMCHPAATISGRWCKSQEDLRRQKRDLGDARSTDIDLARREIDLKIRLNEGRLQALQTGLGHTALGAQVRAETGQFIGPRMLWENGGEPLDLRARSDRPLSERVDRASDRVRERGRHSGIRAK